MGRITLFVSDHCSSSLRTVMTMKALGLPYTIINISKHPEKRKDMMSLSKQMVTPQVFFNTRHVGGANEMIELLQEWDETCNGGSSCDSTVSSCDPSESEGSWSPSNHKFMHVGRRRSSHNTSKTVNAYESVRERYLAEVGRHPDPVDARLAVPTSGPTVSESPCPRVASEVSCIRLPNGDMSTIVEMTEMLKDLLKRSENEVGGVTYKKSFYGHKLITVLCGVFMIPSKEAFVFAQEQLLAFGLIHACPDNGTFNSKLVYRLQCHHTPKVLNSYRISWNALERVDPDSLRLLKGLVSMMQAIEMAVTDMVGNRNVKTATKLPEYITFEEAVCELQGTDLQGMDDDTKMAFGITLYNLMIRYAQIKVGAVPADSKAARDAYFATVKFDVGGHLYSFNDWEHGILRGNAKATNGSAAAAAGAPFERSDARYSYRVQSPDARIMFALHRGGAKVSSSSSSLHMYTPETLNQELDIAAANFCDDKANVMFDKKNHEIHLSEIFRWYRDDFVESDQDLPMVVTSYMKGTRKQKLDRLIDSCGSKGLQVKFIPLDWTCTNGAVAGTTCACDTFDASSLKSDQARGLRGFLAINNARSGGRQ